MTLRVALDHTTHYRYARPVSLSPHCFRLRPAAHGRTPIDAYSLKISPERHFINWQQDPFGNWLARVVFLEPAEELSIHVSLVAELRVINPFDFFLEESAEHCPFVYDEALQQELRPYLEVREDGPRLKAWLARKGRTAKCHTVDFLVALNHELRETVDYTVRLEPGIQSCEETLERATGSCRDSAWLLVQVLRHLGMAARFVSGYLVQLTADVRPLDGPAGTEEDFTDLHAWAEVYVPGAGWIGLDPTSGLFAGEGHIPLACTPDPASAAPVTGAYYGEKTEITFAFDNRVTRIHEDPRVTRPFSDEQWAAIDALGVQVDERLAALDVRLTQGGEPTFVSVDDMDHAQWNTAALGREKRELAGELLLRLTRRFAPGGVRFYGQGKWYPGEPLPRWALSCFWREDGAPAWRNDDLIADERRDYGHGPEQAKAFARALARRLGVDPARALPAYEDVYYYLWKEGTLPTNLDPFDAKLADPVESARLRRVFEQGLERIAGYALPIQWRHTAKGEGWASGAWPLRRERLYLLPGDSPMGYRLPLESLPWRRPEHRDLPLAVDPFAERGPLAPGVQALACAVQDEGRLYLDPHTHPGDAVGEIARHFDHLVGEARAHEGYAPQTLDGSGGACPHPIPPPGGEGEAATALIHLDVVRTALCIEPRDGRLHCFLPPVGRLEQWLDLVAAIEGTAAELAMPIVLEGYEPPPDPRLQRLAVTPDPGVIEVNVHPSASWAQLKQTTEALYEEAHLTRLGTEKFLVDGRHTGTGGGNHITLGGRSPVDSPFLRRPSLLQSLVTYWQHHPGLSYLFSGLFIGPTSQAPRVDEGRAETLYELETAFQQVPRGEVPAPWLVDRLFRHLLTGITGNTHRAEFCVDKLYSPDSTHGRLGLLELRAFEMPPHPRMSLVQALLLRALVARFWETPYEAPLVRWGTALQDRWMLPHFVERDLDEVAAELAAAGYPFDPAWLAPFVEFRFPRLGRVQVGDLDLELRQAIEPWHVLGEESTAQGTARFVDSSVERLQVRLSGLTDSRHVVTCNGRRVPLRNTGTQGEYVAGVRFRAWQPPSALHPTIGIHAPLVFEVIDTWNRQAIGSCTYHVAHPGGRNYDTRPVNAYEAEARRVARFWGIGYTRSGEPVQVREPGPAECNPEYPLTLDLRRAESGG